MQASKTIPLVEPLLPDSTALNVKEQIDTGFIGVGKRTQEFTDALASYVSAPHCLLTVSGTIALSVAAIALGLKPGDEILVPTYGVISTINAFASIGLQPKLVEIEQATGCLSLTHLKAAITEKTKAVCFVNFTGHTGLNIVQIKELCDQHHLPLIEDSACALGHTYDGTFSGLFGTIGIYSFSVPKVLTTGQGGAIVTHDKALYEKAAAYIDQGDLEWRKTQLNRAIGTNLRFNDILSTLGLIQLQHLEITLNRKRTVFQTLYAALENKLYSVPGNQAPLHNIVFPKKPEKFMKKLKEAGISTSRGYKTLTAHPAYHHLAREDYSQSDFWMNHAVFLPFGVALSKSDAEYIAEIVKGFDQELLTLGAH